LSDVAAEWRQGEIVLLAGVTGSGKSTLGKLLKGLLTPDAGAICFSRDEFEETMPPDALLKLTGWADAQPERQMFAPSVWEEIACGPRWSGLAEEDVRDAVFKAFKLVGLDPESYRDRPPLTLSGGEKRQVAIASIAATPARFYIFDEPAAGLDPSGVATLRDVVWRLAEEAAGVMIITHDPDDFRNLADRIWLMKEGMIISDIPAKEADWGDVYQWLESGGIIE